MGAPSGTLRVTARGAATRLIFHTKSVLTGPEEVGGFWLIFRSIGSVIGPGDPAQAQTFEDTLVADASIPTLEDIALGQPPGDLLRRADEGIVVQRVCLPLREQLSRADFAVGVQLVIFLQERADDV
jgi:hypothetical protein